MHLEWMSEKETLIRSIPLCMPYLDLRLYLDAVVALDSLQQLQLLELMNQSQVFDPGLLSLEEKMELNEFLLRLRREEGNMNGVFKQLTNEDCWNLLHV